MTYLQYIPQMHKIVWMIIGAVAIWRLNPFLRAMREACSEPDVNGKRGKVSRKRIIPLLFTGVVCYMVIYNIHSCGAQLFPEVPFWGLLCYIALDTAVITVTQADGFLDKVAAIKGKVIAKESVTEKTTEEQTVERSVATEAK